jgi:hypothetical protein
MTPSYATLSITLDDGQGHTKTIVDEGSDDSYKNTPGAVVWMGALPGSIWSFNIDAAFSKPGIGGQYNPQLDLSVQNAYSTGAGTLTITVTDDLFGPLGNAGKAILSMGGAYNQYSISAKGFVDATEVVSLGPLMGQPWSGSAQGLASGLDQSFTFTETIVIKHTAAGNTKGDINLELVAVPEPATILVGVLLLVPFLVHVIRGLRNHGGGRFL